MKRKAGEEGGALEKEKMCYKEKTKCPSAWAITCLDHFNCEYILSDAREALISGLRRLGFNDIWSGRASECVLRIDCQSRQHIILNANLMNDDWAAKVPKSSILYNLEQLVVIPKSEAIAAAMRAAADSNDVTVAREGNHSLQQILLSSTNFIIGVSVDDYRKFIALPKAAYAFRWLDFSYTNLQLAKLYTDMSCILIKPIALPSSFSQSILKKIEFYHDDQLVSIPYLVDDSDTELTHRVQTIITQRKLTAGAGCDSFHCVLDTLVNKMKSHVRPYEFNIFAAEVNSDVVHLGGIDSDRRTAIINNLLNQGISASILEGSFGERRTHLLKKMNVGLNIHRDSYRQRPEVLRLLAYANAGLPVISEMTDDPLIESEFNSVIFLPYQRILNCTIRLLSADFSATRQHLRRNAFRYAHFRQEHLFLAPIISMLFPACKTQFSHHEE
eukprot:CAMPEP_0197362132 /NCGR_PEP_ID=MMETSP0893-20130614/63811_1 /TAXON_ID=44058 ORGANISM="Aureoumbra lagunensis, Strain CCMP1510" /NCGR_SAMPLE_ID=MMETSP0893 /ASSEMBLY_ACC=CAM_ASM_000539 /LENGTH=443 /DNA_ID=CAMNT_0042883831 /DNA_START=1539 /DNA_END=2871 /DNA_ORIENTATION=+